jgi:hypothetical protein
VEGAVAELPVATSLLPRGARGGAPGGRRLPRGPPPPTLALVPRSHLFVRGRQDEGNRHGGDKVRCGTMVEKVAQVSGA